ncbi:MAG: hypothetical protein J6I49_02075 [Bacteroidales bacterium]|nr:hypothetical protein [Bacteroidales bacterium]
MRKTAFLLAVALLFTACDKPEGESPSSTSEVFPYTKDGQTLYYRIVGDHAEVTHPVPSWDGHLQPEGDIVIPETVTYQGKAYIVTSIGDSAFYDCNMQARYSYINVTIPPTVNNLGDYSLYFSGDVCKIRSLPLIPPVLGTFPFNPYKPGETLAIGGSTTTIEGISAEVYVPCESLELYKSAQGWSSYSSLIECEND